MQPADTLGHIFAALAPGGFLLMLEMCGVSPANVWGLDARTWAFTDEREYGLWMGKARWHALLDAAGFARVAEHWCAPALLCL